MRFTVEPVEGDNQIAITILASDGKKWEYGIPYSPDSGRYTFEELDVIAMDFGDEFAEELEEKLAEVVEATVGKNKKNSLAGACQFFEGLTNSFVGQGRQGMAGVPICAVYHFAVGLARLQARASGDVQIPQQGPTATIERVDLHSGQP